MVDTRMEKLVSRFIDLNWKRYGDAYEYHANEIYEITNEAFEYKDIIESIFLYIMSKGEDPTDELPESILGNYLDRSELYSVLIDSGWVEKFFNKERYLPIKDGVNKGITPYRDIIWEGEKIYLLVDNWEEFTRFFKHSEQDFVERILSEDWAELYGWFDTDWENDIVDNLNDESIRHIKDYVKGGDFIGKEMSEFSMDDEHGFILTEEMVEDTETILRLINEEDIFEELASDITSYYRWAYEGAAEDELSNNIMDQIKDLIGSNSEWVTIKGKGNSNEQSLKFDVTDKFMDFNLSYLECFGLIPEEEESYFLHVISEYLECESEELETQNMDYFYPNSSKVSEHLNYNVMSNL